MNLSRLRAFLTIAEAGSYRRAAERLGFSQPALSRQIQVLESEIGATLFRRGRPPLSLTEAGRFVAAQGGRLLADAALLRQEAMRLHGGRDPTLRVGVLQSLLEGVFAGALMEWRPHWRGVPLRVLGFRSAQIMTEVAEGRQHLGLVGMVPGDPRLHWQELARDEFVAVLPPAHPLAQGRVDALSLAELAGTGLVLPPPTFGLRDTLDAAFATVGVNPRPAAELEGIGAILALVQAGLGPTVLPGSALVGRTGLVARRLADPAPSRSLGAIWHATRKPDESMAALFSAVANVLRSNAAKPSWQLNSYETCARKP
jgi:DNA-binding transcriptional LysR family regulator